jgi:cystathionine beta-lyase
VLRRKIDRAVNINEICDLNPFGPVALEAAYNECEDWLDQLNEYIQGNYTALKDFFQRELPDIKVTKLEGTYLAWIDIKATGLSSDEATGKLLRKGKVRVSSGTIYGRTAGEGFLRINMACPRSLMMQGLERIGRALKD